VIGALPLVIPSYVGAFALLGALGPRGELQQLLEPLGVERLPQLPGFVSALIVLVLFTYPYVLLLVAASLHRVDISLERAARGLGMSPIGAFRHATVPQIRSSIVAGGLLAGLYALGDFGVVSIMRVETLTRQIYLRYGVLFDRSTAAILGLVLCVIALVVLVIERRVLRGNQLAARRRTNARSEQHAIDLGRWQWPSVAFVAIVAAGALVIPLAMLAWWLGSLGADNGWTTRVGETGEALAGSVAASGLGSVAAACLAIPVAILAVRYRSRAAAVIEAIIYSGYALPGVVAALGLTYVATRTAFWLYQTLALLVIAYIIRFLPQAVGATRSAIERVHPSLEAAARGMGRGRFGVMRTVTLPLALPGVLAGAMLVFLTAMKELPATLMLRPTGFETLATLIWYETSVADYREAALPALVLVGVSAVPLWLLVIRPSALARSADDDASEGVASVVGREPPAGS
jgi:iron(III) transport system permease protein